jgi:hypothetical protein
LAVLLRKIADIKAALIPHEANHLMALFEEYREQASSNVSGGTGK